MRDAVEIEIPPSGNHRNVIQTLLMPVVGGKKGNKTCPCCKKSVWVIAKQANTDEYTRWRETAALRLKMKYPDGFSEPVVVFYWIYGGKGFMERRDHDNAMKCIGDAMKDSGIIRIVDASGETKSDDDVRYIKSWRPWYFTREEVMAILKGRGPKKAADLVARCFVHVAPASKVDPFKY